MKKGDILTLLNSTNKVHSCLLVFAELLGSFGVVCSAERVLGFFWFCLIKKSIQRS